MYIHVGGHIVKQKTYNASDEPTVVPFLSSYYDFVDGILLLYDLSRPETIQYIEEQLKCIPEGIPKLIIGNKADGAVEIC